MDDKKKFTVVKTVASFKAGTVIDLDPNQIPYALQAHVVPASSDLEVATPQIDEALVAENEELKEQVAVLEQEVEGYLRDEYEALLGKKAGGNSKLETIRSEIAKAKADKQ